MAAQLQRRLVERWFVGTIPETLEQAVSFLASKLKSLERILSVLHQGVEHPGTTIATRVAASGNTTINSGTAIDITGATVTYTPMVDGTILVLATFLVECATFSAVTDRINGLLVVNAVSSTYGVADTYTAVGERKTISQEFVVPVSAGTQYTLKLTARQAAGTSTYTVISAATGFIWLMIPNLFKAP